MVIRKLLPEDATAFQALRLRGLLEIPSAFSSSHAEEVDTPESVIAQRLASKADGAVLGAFSDTNLAGVIGVQRERQRQLAHKAIIWGMYVAPEVRQKGMGRSLLLRAIDMAARELEVRTVNLGVNTQNKAAITLYESVGFRTYGTEPGFLMVNGELHDEYLMTMSIAGGPRSSYGI